MGGFLKVPIDRVDHLHSLLVGPVGGHHEGHDGQLDVDGQEDGEGHAGPDVVPVAVGDVPEEAFHHRPEVEGVHQKELVGLPQQATLFAGLQQRPAQGRQRGAHLQD